MTREECFREMCISMAFGGLITLFVFLIIYRVCSPLEVVAYWVCTWAISTYGVWSVIDWMDRKKP